MTSAATPMIAIDLGTTNSLIGVFEQGQARLIDNSNGALLTPSAIALDDQGRVLIGQAALELRHSGQPVLTSFKRFMGTDRKLKLGKREFTAPELSALVLQSLKADAEHALGHPITEAVITVPAYFNDIQWQATMTAAHLAGLSVSRLINEPTAAALAYGLGQSDESCFLVFDLGGGTFDVSIVEVFEGVIEVRASTGDNFLGGDDFVQVIADQFWQSKAAELKQDVHAQPQDLAEVIRAKAQLALHALSAASETEMALTWRNTAVTLTITQDEFNLWIEPLLLRLRRPLERALRDARLDPEQIDQIVMVGGATRIPAVRRLIAKLFGRFPLTSIQPDEAIVRGACVQAGLRAKDQSLKEVVLTDVCPFSLGIEIVQDQFSPILERNTVIPASKVNRYVSANAGQDHILLRVFQGENRLCANNIFLGELNVPLPPNKEQLEVDVRFSYNPNGILDVDVQVLKNGHQLQKVLINNQNLMSPDEVARAREQLAALKIHPRDNLHNHTLVLKAERLYSELTGALREHVAAQLRAFEAELDTQDERQIREARTHFEQFLLQVQQTPIFD